MERMINSFWWGGGTNNKGIKWLAWDRMAYPKARGGMGFRDLHVFNMAMVAKQGWNIMIKPHTLVSRIYKARWNIGTGTNIKVMSEPWLRKEDGRWMQAPQTQGRGEEVSDQDDWNCIWKVDASPKAKHLLWRMCRGCLPTRVRLKERCVPCPLACSFCNYDYEDERHIFFNCYDSICARQTAGLDHVLTPLLQQHSNIKELIMNICKLVDRETAGKFAMLLWVLWKNRNNNVWEGMKESGQILGSKALYLWQEWKAVQCSNNNNIQPEMQQQQLHWQQPPFGWLKCNVDAAFHNNSCKTSAGWCLRDHVGQFVTAGSSWSQGLCSIVEGEANALLEAMKEMEHRGFNYAIFETDSQNVADAIRKSRVGNSVFSSLLVHVVCLW